MKTCGLLFHCYSYYYYYYYYHKICIIIGAFYIFISPMDRLVSRLIACSKTTSKLYKHWWTSCRDTDCHNRLYIVAFYELFCEVAASCPSSTLCQSVTTRPRRCRSRVSDDRRVTATHETSCAPRHAIDSAGPHRAFRCN